MDSDGVDDDSEHDEGGEEEPEDADEALTEALEGEEMKEAGDEFEDKEHETQFCLETNFTEDGGQEDADSDAEQDDSKGRKKIHSN